jgi:hypothetical protein
LKFDGLVALQHNRAKILFEYLDAAGLRNADRDSTRRPRIRATTIHRDRKITRNIRWADSI